MTSAALATRSAMAVGRRAIQRLAGTSTMIRRRRPTSHPCSHHHFHRPDNHIHHCSTTTMFSSVTIRHFTVAKYPPDSGDKQKAEDALAASKREDNNDDDTTTTSPASTFEIADHNKAKDDDDDAEKQTSSGSTGSTTNAYFRKLMGESLQPPAGCLWETGAYDNDIGDKQFIPQVALHAGDGRRRKRVLVLCTGGTLTMAPDPTLGGALAPVEGALSEYIEGMSELVRTKQCCYCDAGVYSC